MLTKQKKIAAIVTFAIAGFCAGFLGASEAHAANLGTFYLQFNSSTGYMEYYVPATGSSVSFASNFMGAQNGRGGCSFGGGAATVGTLVVVGPPNNGGCYARSTPPYDGDYMTDMPNGTYVWRVNVDSDYYEDTFVWSGSACTSGCPSPSTASTTIDSITPSGTIASSSPITITIHGKLGTADLASTTAAGNTIRLLSWVGGVDTSFISPNSTFQLLSDGSFTKSYQVTTTLPAGNFKIYASITSAGTYDCSAVDTGGVCVPIGGVNVSTTTFFTLNTSYFEHVTGTSTPTNLYTPQPCGISDLSGCFQNALAAVFYPTVSPGAAFAQIGETAKGKAPFVYVYQIAAVRNELFTASSTAATSVTVPLWKLPGQTSTSTLVMISSTLISNVPYANTVKIIITAILWLLMAEYVYYRVIHMHDTTTPS